LASRRIKLVYPVELVDEPILYQLVRKFDLMTNVRRAEISSDGGWLIVDVRGDEKIIADAMQWMCKLGLGVEEIEN
jgi:ABC-type methionine transport system ATPase subunit